MLYGTTIVLVRTTREMVVAADSKAVTSELIDKGGLCKIIQLEKCFFTSSGFHGDPQRGLSLDDLAREADSLTDNVAKCCRRFIEMVDPILHDVVLAGKREDRAYYETHFVNRAVLSPVFFGVENKSPVFSYCNAMVIPDDTKADGFYLDYRGKDSTELDPGDIHYEVFGHHGAIEEFLAANPDIWRKGLVRACRKLLEAEIEREPDVVGPPIAILRLTSSGAKWVQKTPHCRSLK